MSPRLLALEDDDLPKLSRRAFDLSPREFKLLKFFLEHKGEVITRDQLLNAVWGYDGFPLTRTVDMHIAKLRHKIEDSLPTRTTSS